MSIWRCGAMRRDRIIEEMSMGDSPEEKNAPVLLAEAAEHPTLDELMRRDPAGLTEGERERQVELLRLRRAQYIKAEAEKGR